MNFQDRRLLVSFASNLRDRNAGDDMHAENIDIGSHLQNTGEMTNSHGHASFSIRCDKNQSASPVRHILILLPLLSLYITVVIITYRPPYEGDSAGYIDNAARILRVAEGKRGPYVHFLTEAEDAGPVDPTQDLRLWWGPGYPLLLIPFVAFGLPWIAAELLNGLFHFIAILYFYALIRSYISMTNALIVALCLGLYPPLMRNVSAVGPEDLTLLLVCGFMFHFSALYNNSRRHRLHLLTASLYLTSLAVTKIVFGYVLVTVFAFFLLVLIWRRTPKIRTAAAVFVIALICSVPYLVYTYHL